MIANLLSELPYACGIGLERRRNVVLEFVLLVLERVRCLVNDIVGVRAGLFAFVRVCVGDIFGVLGLVIMIACVTAMLAHPLIDQGLTLLSAGSYTTGKAVTGDAGVTRTDDSSS